MPKKRGGQPNNKNAYQHGFYSRHFTQFESKALDEIPLTDLADEKGIMRVTIDRFMETYTASRETLDYESRLAGLRAISLAVGRIASLERIQASLAKRAEEAQKMKENFTNSAADTTETSGGTEE